jgi:hypothetical protein
MAEVSSDTFEPPQLRTAVAGGKATVTLPLPSPSREVALYATFAPVAAPRNEAAGFELRAHTDPTNATGGAMFAGVVPPGCAPGEYELVRIRAENARTCESADWSDDELPNGVILEIVD